MGDVTVADNEEVHSMNSSGVVAGAGRRGGTSCSQPSSVNKIPVVGTMKTTVTEVSEPIHVAKQQSSPYPHDDNNDHDDDGEEQGQQEQLDVTVAAAASSFFAKKNERRRSSAIRASAVEGQKTKEDDARDDEKVNEREKKEQDAASTEQVGTTEKDGRNRYRTAVGQWIPFQHEHGHANSFPMWELTLQKFLIKKTRMWRQMKVRRELRVKH